MCTEYTQSLKGQTYLHTALRVGLAECHVRKRARRFREHGIPGLLEQELPTDFCFLSRILCTQRLSYLCAYRLYTRPKIAQQIGNDSLFLAQQTKQQMLAPDRSAPTVSLLGLIGSQQQVCSAQAPPVRSSLPALASSPRLLALWQNLFPDPPAPCSWVHHA